jgi:hypothetical protein
VTFMGWLPRLGGCLASALILLNASAQVVYSQGPSDSPSQTAGPFPATNEASSHSQATGSANSGSADREATSSSYASLSPHAQQDLQMNSLPYLLTMSHGTQDRFEPLTQRERAEEYAKGIVSPFHMFTAGVSGALAQWRGIPPAWGQGAEGYGMRFGNYFAKQTVQETLLWWSGAALHEDNRYFGSGDHGAWRRLRYALKSSIMARHDDGKQYLSLSQIGSTAGSAFISRLWQPRTSSSPGDGAMSFGISMGANAGLDVLREFLPDLLRKARLAK